MGWGESPHQPKLCLSPPPGKSSPHPVFIPHIKILKLSPNNNIIFCCSHCHGTVFILISYSVGTQVMLILILVDVQYSQATVRSFEKG